MADDKPRRGRPASGVTPLRNIRIDDERWGAVKTAAHAHRETATDLILRAIDRELARLRRSEGRQRIAEIVESEDLPY